MAREFGKYCKIILSFCVSLRAVPWSLKGVVRRPLKVWTVGPRYLAAVSDASRQPRFIHTPTALLAHRTPTRSGEFLKITLNSYDCQIATFVIGGASMYFTASPDAVAFR